MRSRFGEDVFKVSVDAGFTCPNRDGTIGTSGCIFCNNEGFRPASCSPSLTVTEQVRIGIDCMQRRYRAKKFLVYFQPFTNTYAPVEILESLYTEALANPAVVGLAIGTRPDSVDDQKITLLQSLAEKHFVLIEYGVQSIYEKTLQFINRGHDYETFLRALAMTIHKGILIGAHIIIGMPTETREEMVAMADELSQIPIDFLKIHHLQVMKDTPLAVLYREKPFHVFGFEEYIDVLTEFVGRLTPRIVLQRLFASASDNMLIAPQWDRRKQQILRDISTMLAQKDLWQGKHQRMVQPATSNERHFF